VDLSGLKPQLTRHIIIADATHSIDDGRDVGPREPDLTQARAPLKARQAFCRDDRNARVEAFERR